MVANRIRLTHCELRSLGQFLSRSRAGEKPGRETGIGSPVAQFIRRSGKFPQTPVPTGLTRPRRAPDGISAVPLVPSEIGKQAVWGLDERACGAQTPLSPLAAARRARIVKSLCPEFRPT